MKQPDLSIIVPTLNEAKSLPLLLADLVGQQDISLEVIVSDGGSTDATAEVTRQYFSAKGLPGTCLAGPAGRGRQLNAGAVVARADWLLFLHADSRLPEHLQLRRALNFMQDLHKRTGAVNSAGRFALRFARDAGEDSFALFYYESKARLGRAGCVHGDQGMLLRKNFFATVGPFREDLPVMEDTSLAEQVRKHGEWLLLPDEIVTSARRFATEGWRARQTLNALMMNFLAIGWLDFFAKAPGIYQRQDKTRPLQLTPFFQLIDQRLSSMPAQQSRALWTATGAYVRGQAWQIGLALDCRAAYRKDLEPLQRPGRWLNFFDRWFDPLTSHRFGCLITALLVRYWFARQLRRRI